jgi:FkbM family methyltransferase
MPRQVGAEYASDELLVFDWITGCTVNRSARHQPSGVVGAARSGRSSVECLLDCCQRSPPSDAAFTFDVIMNFQALSSETLLGKIARLPLSLVPRGTVVRILRGTLRGKRWIVGSAIHRCWLGFYEYEKQRLISREVRPNSVFWDIGANVGFYSLLASKLVRSGKVFAFEPVPRNLEYLRKHVVLNRVTNVEVLPIAVSDKDGISSFRVEQTGLMGHLSGEGNTTVSTAALDTLVEEGKVLPPDYVKMDIEGAELLALRGASRTFQRFRPVLFLATHGREVEAECRRLLELWGYDCRNIGSKSNSELGEIIAKFRVSRK